jgi:uncharacterized membrane-anchored protein
MNRRALLFVVALPVTYMAFWLASLALVVSSAKEITLRVEGYDPRDLLSGHYLRYQVNYGISIPNDLANDGDICACFDEEPATPASARWIGSCAEMKDDECPLHIRGRVGWGSRFEAEIERYYIPEQYAEQLQRVPENTTIRVAVPTNGRAIVRGMYVDGVDIVEWAKRR